MARIPRRTVGTKWATPMPPMPTAKANRNTMRPTAVASIAPSSHAATRRNEARACTKLVPAAPVVRRALAGRSAADPEGTLRGQADRADRRRSSRPPPSRRSAPTSTFAPRRRHRSRGTAERASGCVRRADSIRDPHRRRGDRGGEEAQGRGPCGRRARQRRSAGRHRSGSHGGERADLQHRECGRVDHRPHPEPRPTHPGRTREPGGGGVEAVGVHRHRALREDRSGSSGSVASARSSPRAFRRSGSTSWRTTPM